jgi:hypothetical protein
MSGRFGPKRGGGFLGHRWRRGLLLRCGGRPRGLKLRIGLFERAAVPRPVRVEKRSICLLGGDGLTLQVPAQNFTRSLPRLRVGVREIAIKDQVAGLGLRHG